MRVKPCGPPKLRGGWLVEIWSGCEWDSGNLLHEIGPGPAFRGSFRITKNRISGICSTSLTINTWESIGFVCSTVRARVQQRTYAPAARQESVRLFHIVLVEEGYFLGQYDVPQAFLLAPIDNDIFVYPPAGQSEYPGQILQLQKALYGGKQSAYLWFTMINAFILELRFVASPMNSCLYKRHDAILILYCDDLRIGASKIVLEEEREYLLKMCPPDMRDMNSGNSVLSHTGYNCEINYSARYFLSRRNNSGCIRIHKRERSITFIYTY
jgi:hypothetical protein